MSNFCRKGIDLTYNPLGNSPNSIVCFDKCCILCRVGQMGDLLFFMSPKFFRKSGWESVGVHGYVSKLSCYDYNVGVNFFVLRNI